MQGLRSSIIDKIKNLGQSFLLIFEKVTIFCPFVRNIPIAASTGPALVGRPPVVDFDWEVERIARGKAKQILSGNDFLNSLPPSTTT